MIQLVSADDVLRMLTEFYEQKAEHHLASVAEKAALLIARRMIANQDNRFFQVDSADGAILSITDITDRLQEQKRDA